MDALRALHIGLYLVLALLAWIVASRERAHRWVAAFITWMATTDLLRALLLWSRRDAERPYTGLARVTFHFDEICVLSWYWLLIALCTHYFLRRKPWGALWVGAALFFFCLNYPLVSREVLAWVYRFSSFACIAATWGIILFAMIKRSDLRPGIAHLILMLYAGTEVVVVLVPNTRGFLTQWPLVRIANLLLLVSASAAHVWWLVKHRSAPEAAR